MNVYDEEIFNFFSNEDNFRNMYKVAGHYEYIKKRLLEEFWELVTKKLLALNIDNKWHFKMLEKLSSNTAKLFMYKLEWHQETNMPVVAVAFERLGVPNWPFYGVFINNNAKSYDIRKMVAHIRSLPIANSFDKDNNTWWGLWNDTGINFSLPEDFIKILPGNREDLASDFANKLYSLGIELENELEKMAEMKIS